MTVKSADLFKSMVPHLAAHGADICKKIGAIYLFEIKASKDATPVLFTVDLKNGKGIT
jgi:hypothetical protein